MTRKEIMDQLESILDKSDLTEILGALWEVSEEKAQHVFATWGDRNLAQAWHLAANYIAAAEAKINLKISNIPMVSSS